MLQPPQELEQGAGGARKARTAGVEGGKRSQCMPARDGWGGFSGARGCGGWEGGARQAGGALPEQQGLLACCLPSSFCM